MVESMQEGAPPAAQKSMITRLANFEEKKELAKAIAGIK